MKIASFFKGFREGFRNFSFFAVSAVNFALLSVVYLLGIGLVSIFGKLFGKHFLDMKLNNRKSYWIERRMGKEDFSSYYNEF